MKIKFDIWSKKKEGKPNHIIEDHIEIEEQELCDLFLEKWLEDHDMFLKNDRTYRIEIDQVIHD